MIRCIFLLTFAAALAAQSPFSTERDLMFSEQNWIDFSGEVQPIQNDENAKLSPPRSLLYSLAVPGLAQYINGDRARAYVYFGLEIAGIALYAAFKNEGNDQTKRVEAYVNNSSTGFDRIRFYRNLYIAANGGAAIPTELLGSDQNGAFSELKKNSALYADLRQLERDLGDGVHSLPETKTQQYYEMVGKYYMFYHGWKHPSMTGIGVGQNTGETPAHIETYYNERDKMNAAFENAKWAVTGVLINHVVSGIEAFMSSKKRLHISAKSELNHGEFTQMLEVQYDF